MIATLNLAAILDAAAARRPDDIAILHEGRLYSYATLRRLTDRVANALAAQGIGRGARVALCCTNRPGFVAAYFGILKTGATAVLLSTVLPEADLLEQLELSGAELLLAYDRTAARDYAPIAAAARRRARHCRGLYLIPADPFGPAASDLAPSFADLIAGAADRAPCYQPKIADSAAILFTSGTTGKQRGVMLSHHALFQMTELNRSMAIPEVEKLRLVANPLFHIMGLVSGLQLTLLAGTTMLLMEEWDPERAWWNIFRFGCSYMAGMPAIYRDLLDHSGPVATQSVASCLKLCATGGGPLNPALSAEWQARFCLPLVAGYGLTESASLISWHAPADPIRDHSVGKPIPGLALELRGEDGRRAAPGAIGEIWVRSPGLMSGYLGRPDLTRRFLKRGWLRTGDVGRLDDEGYLFIEARDGKIIQGDEHIYPMEIQRALYRHPSVADAAVLSLDHPELGEEAVAFVSLRGRAVAAAAGLAGARRQSRASPTSPPAIGRAELMAFLARELPQGKSPNRLLLLPELPRTASGKVDRAALARRLEGKLPAQSVSPREARARGMSAPTPASAI